jgi:hypothetical protein
LGRPGEGKTLFSVRHLILETLLRDTRRKIATNIVLDWEKADAWFSARGVVKVDRSRVVLLPDEDEYCDQFRALRSVNPKASCSCEVCEKGFKRVSFHEWVPKGAMVVIDEAGDWFNALDSRQVGMFIGKYARRHRHLGHDTYFVVQNRDHLQKQLRDIIQEDIYLRKWSIPFFGWFSAARCHPRDTKPHKWQFYGYPRDVFGIYNTLQYADSLKTAEDWEVEENEGEPVKVSAWQKFKALVFGSPIASGMVLVGLVVVGAVAFVGYQVLNMYSPPEPEPVEVQNQIADENQTSEMDTGPLGDGLSTFGDKARGAIGPPPLTVGAVLGTRVGDELRARAIGEFANSGGVGGAGRGGADSGRKDIGSARGSVQKGAGGAGL